MIQEEKKNYSTSINFDRKRQDLFIQTNKKNLYFSNLHQEPELFIKQNISKWISKIISQKPDNSSKLSFLIIPNEYFIKSVHV